MVGKKLPFKILNVRSCCCGSQMNVRLNGKKSSIYGPWSLRKKVGPIYTPSLLFTILILLIVSPIIFWELTKQLKIYTAIWVSTLKWRWAKNY